METGTLCTTTDMARYRSWTFFLLMLIKELFTESTYVETDSNIQRKTKTLDNILTNIGNKYNISNMESYNSDNGSNFHWNTRKPEVEKFDDFERIFLFETVAELDNKLELPDEKLRLQNHLFLNGKKKCVHLQNFHQKWIEMVTLCPSYYKNKKIEELCHMTLEHGTDEHLTETYSQNCAIFDTQRLPVQDDKGTVYGNIFCAACNQATSIHIWDSLVQCDNPSRFSLSDAGKEFTLFQSLPYGKCSQILIPAIQSKVRSCQPEISKQSPRKRKSAKEPFLLGGLSEYPISFTVLMNFGFDGKTHVLFSNTHLEIDHIVVKRCPDDSEIFIAKNNRCRKIHCSKNYVLTELGCVSRNHKTKNKLIHPANGTWDTHSLASLNQVARVSLDMNVTYGDLPLVISPMFEKKMVDSISNLLNITSKRIQNFTFDLLNETTTDGNFQVNAVTGVNSENMPSLQRHASVQKHTPKENASLSSKEYVEHNLPFKEKHHPNQNWNSEDNLKCNFIGNPQITVQTIPYNIFACSKKLKTTKDYLNQKFKTKSQALKNNCSTQRVTTKKPGISKNFHSNPVGIRISFLLLPSRKHSEEGKSVSSVVRKMKEVIAQQKFTLIFNKTVIKVLDKNKESDQWVGSDFCDAGSPMTLFSDEFDILLPNPEEGRNMTWLYVNKTQTIFRPGQYQMSIIVEASGDVTNVHGFAIVCKMPRIADDSCGRFEVPKTEYVLLANRSVAVSGKLYNISQYSYVDPDLTAIEICIPEEYYQQQTRLSVVPGCDKGYEGFAKADSYLTAVLGRVSIVTLALVLMTYVLFRQLRNLPGFNIMNLTLALLIGETIFALGEKTKIPWMCSGVAVSLHYFFLASFFWMNVMTYDVYNTFANNHFLVRIRDKKKYSWRYCMYGWGAPFVVVATCVFLDFSNIISGFRIGYGQVITSEEASSTEDHQYLQRNITNNDLDPTATDNKSEGCWIQSPGASLAVFGAPMLVTFIVNGFLFIKTIVSIQNTTKLAQLNNRRSSVNHMTGRYEVMLYVRMSTVMGFTWIFGLASSLVSVMTTTPTRTICYTVHMLAILFTIFNCSQGLFIFFAFIVKKRVFYMYRTLWHRIRNHSRSPFFIRHVRCEPT